MRATREDFQTYIDKNNEITILGKLHASTGAYSLCCIFASVC